jgi:hypothetical protein
MMSDELRQPTEGVTFRIPSSSVNKLRKESKKKQISLNTLINQIIKDHLEWHTYAGLAGMIPIPRATFNRLLNEFSDDEISKFAVAVAEKDLVDVGLFLEGEITVQTFVSRLEKFSRISNFPYRHEISDENHNFIIQHDMGRNFSFFLKGIYRHIMEEMLDTKLDVTVTDNTIVLKFKN